MHHRGTARERKKLFIGSSTEQLLIANALRDELEFDDYVRPFVWNQAGFALSHATIEDLERFLAEYYYAVFILAPDDDVTKRDHLKPAPRDNVIFELGLFLGRAGRERTFVVYPRGIDFHLPTDLKGLSPATYLVPTDDDEVRSNVSYAAHQIQKAIRQHERAKELETREYAKRAKEEMHRELSEAASDRERLAIFHSRVNEIIGLQSQALRITVREAIEDLILLATSAQDILDSEQLSFSQRAGTKEVWVFAAKPLELLSMHEALREVVIQNLRNGVKYRYFIESDEVLADVVSLREDAAGQNALSNNRNLPSIEVAVLAAIEFPTHFTVEFKKKGPPSVFQSVVRPDRADILFTLGGSRAEAAIQWIERKWANLSGGVEDGIHVRRFPPNIEDDVRTG
jgi:hypothetical protein